MPSELAPQADRWTAAQKRAQYGAIARLRWRILINGFRRKGSTGDIIALVITFPLFAVMGLGASFAGGYLAYDFVHEGEVGYIAGLLWGTFLICQFLNMNMGQPGTTFDPTQLIRFPLRARSYVLIKLFFGILSPANVVVAILSVAIAIGMALAQPALWLYAVVAMALFAVTNAVFTRMVFAWVDRWLSTRRARELFTAIIFMASMGFQYVNVNYNPAYGHRHNHSHTRNISPERVVAAEKMYDRVKPVLNLFPPGLIGHAMEKADAKDTMGFIGYTSNCLLFAIVFFAIFALRTKTEFRGEVFSDQANAVKAEPAGKTAPASAILRGGSAAEAERPRALQVSPSVAAVFAKEILSMRRNSGLFYSLVAPIVVVLILAGRMASGNNSAYVFPAALAYSLLGVAPLAFNSFGLEGAGCQFYFMAPVRMRDVFLAKNLINFLLAYVEAGAVLVVVTYMGAKPSATMLVSGLLWAAATLMITITFGNRRSVSTPKKIDLGRTSSKQASPLSALLSIGTVALSAAAAAGMLALAVFFDRLWMLPIGMAVLCLVAFVVYVRGLTSIERYMLAHREEMFAELCKGQ
jgi:ABC-2 type transport system permease protein